MFINPDLLLQLWYILLDLVLLPTIATSTKYSHRDQ